MMQEKLVSVVIAAYNMGDYLPLAIDSVLAQTYKKYEIIVVDDGSIDNTHQVMQKYSSYNNILYHRQENSGQAVAKNKGILTAKGDFIAFLDADDMWSHDKLEKQISFFDNDTDVGVVYTSYRLISEKGELLETPRRQHYSGYITNNLFIDNFVTGMTSIVRRECFDKVGVFDETLPMGIDYDLWLRISAYYKFIFADIVTYYYRQWPGQMSHKHKKRFECAVKIMSDFERNHKNVLDKNVVHEAWAHLYVSQGYNQFIKENDRIGGMKYFLMSIKHKPMYVMPWKGILKVILNYKHE